MTQINLDGTWAFRAIAAGGEAAPPDKQVTRWMSGEVPGTVHTDLLRAGIIPDPFLGAHELDVQWIENQQ